MYISYNWLKNYLPDLDKIEIKDLATKLSHSLAEVEEIVERGGELANIVVGEIKDVKNHPNSEKLMIANVDTGDKVRQIVFAASNKEYVQPGTKYPVCLPDGKMYDRKGETVPGKSNSQKIKEVHEVELEGEISQGVLCSPKELGLFDEETGISIISDDMHVGDNLITILHDYILEIENKSLTHRPDCFSHRGIAREIASMMNIEFLNKEEASNPVKQSETDITVHIDTNNCKRFTGIVLQNIEVKKSPAWMQILLAYTGNRPINNIVDISNFIMLDTGYPTHMYDYDKIADATLIVRQAENGEKVDALNQKTYELDQDMTVVADTKGVEDIAGIMGAAHSEITDQTKTVIIESAAWDMFNIRKTSNTLGINSEASNRFSKGLAAGGTLETVKRAVMLVEDLAGGEVSSDIIDILNLDGEINENGLITSEEKEIKFYLGHVRKLIGIDIPKTEILAILKSLEIEIEGDSEIRADLTDNTVESPVTLKIPYYRKDLNIAEDICEEVARIYGYENIKPSLPSMDISPTKLNSYAEFDKVIRKYLTQTGMYEVYNYAFVGKDTYEKSQLKTDTLIRLKNPISPDLEYFRSEITPSLLEKVSLNINNFDDFGLFEISKVVNKKIKTEEDLPLQPKKLGGLIVSGGAYINSENKGEIYYDLKKKLDYFFQSLKLKNVKYSNSEGVGDNIVKLLHPNKSARIEISGEIIGFVGELNPIVKNNFGYGKYQIACFELNYEKIKELYEKLEPSYKEIINTSETIRDLNIWLANRSEVGEIINTLKNENIEYIKEVEMVDVFTKEEKTSLTARFTITNTEKTLTEDEINASMEKVKTIVKEKLGLSLRDK